MKSSEMFTPKNLLYGGITAVFVWAFLYLALSLDVAHSFNPENPEGLPSDPENRQG